MTAARRRSDACGQPGHDRVGRHDRDHRSTSQPAVPYGTPDAPRVAVRGEARLEFDPEIARIGVTVSARGTDRRAALDDLTRRNTAVLDLVKSYGDAVEKLETGAFSITPELTDKGRGERVRAYHGRVHITAELTDFTALGELTTRLADLDLTRVDGPWWALRPDSPAHRRGPAAGGAGGRASAPASTPRRWAPRWPPWSSSPTSARRTAGRAARTPAAPRAAGSDGGPAAADGGPASTSNPSARRSTRRSTPASRCRRRSCERGRARERSERCDRRHLRSSEQPLRTFQHLSITLHAKVVE